MEDEMSDDDTTGTMTLAIDSITIGERKRQAHDVQALAESIATLGLLQPIVVTPQNGAYHLVAGYHRLLACRSLGWTTIDAIVLGGDDLLVELAEIDENLIRNELSYLERAEHLARRKEIYEALYPEAKKGLYGHKGTQVITKAENEIVSFSEDTATKTGLTPRSIQYDVQIATQIAPDVRDAIRGSPLAYSKQDLLVLARQEPDIQRQIVEHIQANVSDDLSVNGKTVWKAAQVVKAALLPEPPPLPPGEYDVILADPPWRYDFSATVNREVENHYPTMSLEEIKAIAVPAAKDAALFLWATAPLLPYALEVMAAWGFAYRTCAVWDKEKIGMGYWFRVQHELLLVGVKGAFRTPEPSVRVSSVIRAERQEHSRKPEIVYAVLEDMFPEARLLELFARQDSQSLRPRWSAWGKEAACSTTFKND
jgi:N6-adenosine-specific RNA methylase IME4